MKKRLLAGAMAVASIAALLAGCGGSGSSQAAGDATANTASAEGQVINIYSWNDEFRTRLEAVYPEVDHTSDDGTVTYLKDGTEIHWVINPNQDGVYQQKLDEALLNQATAAADDNPCLRRADRAVVFVPVLFLHPAGQRIPLPRGIAAGLLLAARRLFP